MPGSPRRTRGGPRCCSRGRPRPCGSSRPSSRRRRPTWSVRSGGAVMHIHKRGSSTTTAAVASSRALGARLLAGALLASSCLAGCAKSTAPVAWLPRPVDAQKVAHGGWISLHTLGSPRRSMHEGELLAIQSDSVFILEGSCVGIPISQIEKGTLTGYDPEARRLALWTL